MPGAQRAAEQLLAVARIEAERIVAEAKAQVPEQRSSERPADGLKPAPWLLASLLPYRDADGTVWLRLSAPVAPDETHRECTKCRTTKQIKQFNKDPKGKNGRRLRCSDCDNEARRNRRSRKQRESSASTRVVSP